MLVTRYTILLINVRNKNTSFVACKTAHASNIGAIDQLGNGCLWESGRPKEKEVNKQTGNNSNHH